MRNRDRRPKEYAIATASNGRLTAGGRVVGYTGDIAATGKFIVIKSSATTVAIKTTAAR